MGAQVICPRPKVSLLSRHESPSSSYTAPFVSMNRVHASWPLSSSRDTACQSDSMPIITTSQVQKCLQCSQLFHIYYLVPPMKQVHTSSLPFTSQAWQVQDVINTLNKETFSLSQLLSAASMTNDLIQPRKAQCDD